MIQKIIKLSILLYSLNSFAQTGIYTNNPQTSFHVDAGKDNAVTGAPTAVQQANDLVVTNTGNVGIGTTAPSERLDLNTGNLRIRTINTNVGIAGTDRPVVADANGTLKTVGFATTTIFHSRLAADQNVTNSGTIYTLLFANPLVTSAFYTYNATNGTLTFNQPGNYIISLQVSFGNVNDGTQLVLGIRPFPDSNYLARGSHYAGAATPTLNGTTRIGELVNYTTMLVVPTAGYQVRFTAAPNEDCVILSSEIGPTGSGNVSNVTIQKI